MKVLNIPCKDIIADQDENYSRERVSPAECQDLAASIELHGLQQPVIVKELGDNKYKLVAGFRRFVAISVNLGRESIDAVVTTAENVSEINLIENLQRKDLSYWEECCAVRQAFHPDTKVSEIIRALSKSRNWVRARWFVWNLPPEVLDKIESGLLGYSEVIALVQEHGDVVAASKKILQGKAEGKSKAETIAKVKNYTHVRSKRIIQQMMTRCLELGRMEAVQALRYVITDIEDVDLIEWFENNPLTNQESVLE